MIIELTKAERESLDRWLRLADDLPLARASIEREGLMREVERIVAARLAPLAVRAEAIEKHRQYLSRLGAIEISVPLGGVVCLLRQIANGEDPDGEPYL